MRNIPPLDFDAGEVNRLLQAFKSDTTRTELIFELEELYEDLDETWKREGTIDFLGSDSLNLTDEEEFLD